MWQTAIPKAHLTVDEGAYQAAYGRPTSSAAAAAADNHLDDVLRTLNQLSLGHFVTNDSQRDHAQSREKHHPRDSRESKWDMQTSQEATGVSERSNRTGQKRQKQQEQHHQQYQQQQAGVQHGKSKQDKQRDKNRGSVGGGSYYDIPEHALYQRYLSHLSKGQDLPIEEFLQQRVIERAVEKRISGKGEKGKKQQQQQQQQKHQKQQQQQQQHQHQQSKRQAPQKQRKQSRDGRHPKSEKKLQRDRERRDKYFPRYAESGKDMLPLLTDVELDGALWGPWPNEGILRRPDTRSRCLLQGQFRVNPLHENMAYVTVPGVNIDILIDGKTDRNRALPDDIVVVEIAHPRFWRTKPLPGVKPSVPLEVRQPGGGPAGGKSKGKKQKDRPGMDLEMGGRLRSDGRIDWSYLPPAIIEQLEAPEVVREHIDVSKKLSRQIRLAYGPLTYDTVLKRAWDELVEIAECRETHKPEPKKELPYVPSNAGLTRAIPLNLLALVGPACNAVFAVVDVLNRLRAMFPDNEFQPTGRIRGIRWHLTPQPCMYEEAREFVKRQIESSLAQTSLVDEDVKSQDQAKATSSSSANSNSLASLVTTADLTALNKQMSFIRGEGAKEPPSVSRNGETGLSDVEARRVVRSKTRLFSLGFIHKDIQVAGLWPLPAEVPASQTETKQTAASKKAKSTSGGNKPSAGKLSTHDILRRETICQLSGRSVSTSVVVSGQKAFAVPNQGGTDVAGKYVAPLWQLTFHPQDARYPAAVIHTKPAFMAHTERGLDAMAREPEVFFRAADSLAQKQYSEIRKKEKNKRKPSSSENVPQQPWQVCLYNTRQIQVTNHFDDSVVLASRFPIVAQRLLELEAECFDTAKKQRSSASANFKDFAHIFSKEVEVIAKDLEAKQDALAEDESKIRTAITTAMEHMAQGDQNKARKFATDAFAMLEASSNFLPAMYIVEYVGWETGKPTVAIRRELSKFDLIHSSDKVLPVLLSSGVMYTSVFPEEVENEIANFLESLSQGDADITTPRTVLTKSPGVRPPWKVPLKEEMTRADLRHLRIFSIDPITARDLDDALSIEPLGNGLFRVGVHIADVSFFVRPGTKLDEEAAFRATSVYLTGHVVPMLPRSLCEDLCSLNPEVDRLAFSCFFIMNENGALVDPTNVWFGKSIIRSCAKLDYGTAQCMVDACGPLGVEELKYVTRGDVASTTLTTRVELERTKIAAYTKSSEALKELKAASGGEDVKAAAVMNPSEEEAWRESRRRSFTVVSAPCKDEDFQVLVDNVPPTAAPDTLFPLAVCRRRVRSLVAAIEGNTTTPAEALHSNPAIWEQAKKHPNLAPFYEEAVRLGFLDESNNPTAILRERKASLELARRTHASSAGVVSTIEEKSVTQESAGADEMNGGFDPIKANQTVEAPKIPIQLTLEFFPEIVRDVRLLHALGMLRRARRFATGSLTLDKSEMSFSWNEDAEDSSAEMLEREIQDKRLQTFADAVKRVRELSQDPDFDIKTIASYYVQEVDSSRSARDGQVRAELTDLIEFELNRALGLDRVNESNSVRVDSNPLPRVVAGVTQYPMHDTNRMIEEYMLLANIFAARRIAQHFPHGALLRSHPPPNERKLAAMAQLLELRDFRLSMTSAGDFQESLNRLQEYERTLLSVLATKCAEKGLEYPPKGIPGEEFLLTVDEAIKVATEQDLAKYPTASIFAHRELEDLPIRSPNTPIVLPRIVKHVLAQHKYTALPLRTFVVRLLVEPMKQANYFTTGDFESGANHDDWAHYALAFPEYTHFTSPIRRYPDVIVHRQLEASVILENPTVDSPAHPFSCAGLSRKTTREMEATLKKLASDPSFVVDTVAQVRRPRQFEVLVRGDDADEGKLSAIFRAAADAFRVQTGRSLGAAFQRFLSTQFKLGNVDNNHRGVSGTIEAAVKFVADTEVDALVGITANCNTAKKNAKSASDMSKQLLLCELVMRRTGQRNRLLTRFEVFMKAFAALGGDILSPQFDEFIQRGLSMLTIPERESTLITRLVAALKPWLPILRQPSYFYSCPIIVENAFVEEVTSKGVRITVPRFDFRADLSTDDFAGAMLVEFEKSDVLPMEDESEAMDDTDEDDEDDEELLVDEDEDDDFDEDEDEDQEESNDPGDVEIKSNGEDMEIKPYFRVTWLPSMHSLSYIDFPLGSNYSADGILDHFPVPSKSATSTTFFHSNAAESKLTAKCRKQYEDIRRIRNEIAERKKKTRNLQLLEKERDRAVEEAASNPAYVTKVHEQYNRRKQALMREYSKLAPEDNGSLDFAKKLLSDAESRQLEEFSKYQETIRPLDLVRVAVSVKSPQMELELRIIPRLSPDFL